MTPPPDHERAAPARGRHVVTLDANTTIAPAGRIAAVMANVQRDGPMTVPASFEVAAIMGNVALDLRGATFAAATTEIRVRATFGNIEIMLPHGTEVENLASAVLGSLECRGRATGGRATQRVRLTGRVVLGSVQVTIGEAQS